MARKSAFEQDEELLNALRELSAAVYEDPGYHTPKNIFNPAMTKSMERPNRITILSSKAPSPSADENPYSSLRKSKVKAIRSWDVEALVSKETDPVLSETSNPTTFRQFLLQFPISWWNSLDSCDYALGIALILTVALFLIGIFVILY